MALHAALSAPPTPVSARTRLREASAADHARVDQVYSRFDLGRIEGYTAFLQAQSACVAPIEAAITAAAEQPGMIGANLLDWPHRQRAALLEADLHELGARGAPAALAPAINGPDALLGCLYVLEGSRFGGAMLRRRLPDGAPSRFLGGQGQPGAWRQLVEALDRRLTTPRRLDAAIHASRAVFQCFENAGRKALEQRHG